MYTLRKLVEDVQHNQFLGSQYQVIDKETNPEQFHKASEIIFGEKVDDNCYAIIIYDYGSEFIPLYKCQSNYIMTESGKTFSNLTYK